MQDDRPRVSVIVPNYNHERYLKERLESILNQSYRDFELILLDDASSDSSPDILRGYAGHPKTALLEINSENSGSPFRQWKKGVEAARGELIWIAESDDSAEPGFLERMVALIDAGADLACCRPQKIDEEGRPFTDAFWAESLDSERWTKDYQNEGPDEIRDYLCYRCTIPSASACLFRKRGDLFSEPVLNSRTTGDWLFWVNYLRKGRIAFTAERLSYHRSHEGTTRSQHDFDGQYRRMLERLTAIRTGRELTGKGWIRPSEVWKYRYLIRMIDRLKHHPEKNRPVLSVVPPELVLYSWLSAIRERFQPVEAEQGTLSILIHTQKSSWEGFTVGGAETSLQLLAEKLADRGHRVVYLTEARRTRLPHYKAYERNGVQVYAIGYPDLPSLGWKPLLRLRRRIAEIMFDRAVVRIVRRNGTRLFHTYHELPAMYRVLQLRKRKKMSVATVLRMAGLFWASRLEEQPDPYTSTCYEEVFRTVDCLNPITAGIYALSRREFDRFGLRIPEDRRIAIQDIGVELSALPGNWSPDASDGISGETRSRRHTIVMASRLSTRQKRQELLIDAMALLPDSLDAELLLVGDGPARPALEESIHRKGLMERVRLIPFMDQSELWSLLRRCDLYTHACDFEGLSKVIVEAMAMGVPVLVSDVTPLNDYIEEGRNGFLVENSPDAWAARIRRLLEQPQVRAAVSGPARETVRDRFDAERNTERYEELFRELTS